MLAKCKQNAVTTVCRTHLLLAICHNVIFLRIFCGKHLEFRIFIRTFAAVMIPVSFADRNHRPITNLKSLNMVKRLLLSTMAATIVCAFASAQISNAAARLTAEGKEWNYDCTKYFGIKPICTTPSKSLRFSGKTIKGGREYFVLTSSKNTADTVALIREEDGKVYVCADSPVLHVAS